MKLKNPKNYINRELSWLDFNNRVLEEASDKYNPLLEKLKFISITSSNLDEFFMIRVSGLKEQVAANYQKRDYTFLSAKEQLSKISKKTHSMIKKQYSVYNNQLLNDLSQEGIHIHNYTDLKGKRKQYINNYFEDIIFPILTPLAIDSSRPFPLLINKAIYIAVSITIDNEEKFAFIQVPSVFPRIIKIPEGFNEYSYIFSEDIICNNLKKLFKGITINNYSLFRITRNADLLFDEEEADDLLYEIEKQVKQRKWGNPVRLELEKKCKSNLKTFLLDSFSIGVEDLYLCDGPLDLTCFMGFSLDLSNYYNLSFKDNTPSNPYKNVDLFELISKNNLLLHFPYESFDPVLDFLNQAASDKDVLAIKHTLYRVSSNSPVISALIRASKNNKQVTVLVELKARFDEENNISWAKKLEQAGCHVVYGLPNLKIHSKMLLVIRKESSGIKRYMNFATGNFNDKTAKLYTDLSFFTCREDFADDVSSLFNYLTGYTTNPIMKKLITSPNSLRDFLQRKIGNEIINVKAGFKSHIMLKMNSLVDIGIIKLLYKASCEGVKIDLIVRGICCLKPNIKNLSENITVRSIVGRYLEHSRIYYFYNNNNPLIYLGSADLMPRNIDRRVEVLFPIERDTLKKKITNIFDIQLSDTQKARFMKSDGTYSYYKTRNVNAQSLLYSYYSNLNKED